MSTLERKGKKNEDLPSSESQEEEHELTDNRPTAQEQNSEAITFGSQPISIKCPFCLQRTKSQIIAKPELVSIVFGLLIFSILPNAIMIVVVVMILQITATRKHRCSLCERQIGSDGKFLIYFKDQVYSFSFGESGVLISKKILTTGGLFLIMLIILTIKANTVPDITWSQMTWRDLIEKCPSHTQNHACRFENDGFSVKNWKGYVMRIDDNRESLRRFYEHAISIYVKMSPPQADENHPDVLLTGTSSIIYDILDTLDNLNHGDQIVFNGTFALMRKPQYVSEDRHFHLINLNKTGVHEDSVQVFVTGEEEIQLGGRVIGSGLRVESDTSQNAKKIKIEN